MARWLLCVAVLVMAMVVVGGITRLTESGVSITEWKPVAGAIPPLTQIEWQTEFDAYRRTPQFIRINGPAGMTLSDYKAIFFWEWLHRLLARLVGMVFAGGLVWFWVKRHIPAGYKPRLLFLLALGGLQGVIGWWMVKSGIVNDVKVSHFRLATHLLVALTTLAALVWTALDLHALARGDGKSRMTRFGAFALAVLVGQLFYGALMAGLRAGHVAAGPWFDWSNWPLMQGRFFPAGIDWSPGVWHALLDDPFLVHFVHRWWAVVVVIVLTMLGRRLRRQRLRSVSIALHSVFGTQFLLGVATVMSGIGLGIAVLHQLGGAALVAVTTWSVHALGRERAGT